MTYAEKSKITALNSTLSAIILNVNGLHTPVKRQRLEKWIAERKHDATLCYLQATHFRFKNISCK